MVIINPTVPSQPAAVNRPAGPAPVIPADRVLIATVLGERANHLYELASGNLRMMAESQTPLRSGEELRLMLSGRDSRQRPTLRILNAPTSEVNQQLRLLLPEQRPLPQAMATLVSAALQSSQQPATQFARILLGVLPQPEALSEADSLRKQLLRSGMFLESNLLTSGDPNSPKSAQVSQQSDLKAAMLTLLQQLQDESQTAAAKATAPIPAGKGNAGAGSYPPASSISPAPSPSTSPSSQSGAAPLVQSGVESGPDPSNRQLLLARAYPAPLSGSELPGELAPQGRKPLPNPAVADGHLEHRLLADIKSALARIESNQLLHLRQPDSQQPSLMIELPVLDRDGVDVWQMQFQWDRDQQQRESADATPDPGAGTERRWQVKLSFDLPGLGPIQVALDWQQDKLQSRFHFARSETLSLFERHLDELRDGLLARGVDSPQLALQLGMPSPSGDSSLSDTTFIRVKA